jgi:hypothetical protein
VAKAAVRGLLGLLGADALTFLAARTSNMYEPASVFPPSKAEVHDPGASDVELYVVRAPRDHHSGLMFVTPQASWVLDLALAGTFAALLPVVSDGAATAKNFAVVGYYSPQDHAKWRPAWERSGPSVATVSAELCRRVTRYVVDVLGPTFSRYVLFGQAATPVLSAAGGVETQSAVVFSDASTSDRLPQGVFEWLYYEQGVDVGLFPVTRFVLSSAGPPTRVGDRDPGLLAWARDVAVHEPAISDVSGREVDAAHRVLTELCKSAVDPLRYVASLEPGTGKQRWWKVAPGKVVVVDAQYNVRGVGGPSARRRRWTRRKTTVVVASCVAVAVLAVVFGAVYGTTEALRRRGGPDLSGIQLLALERAVGR